MKLDVLALDVFRDAWRSGERDIVLREPVSLLTLGAVAEAACWHANGDAAETKLIAAWSAKSQTLRHALVAMGQGYLARPDAHAVPRFELRQCPSRAELESVHVGVEWQYFLDRFRRSLVNRLGLSSSKGRALAAALHEMVDNVVEHAGLGDMPRGIVGYEVVNDSFALAVADIGQGVLASVHENATHAAIATDGEALMAAVTGGASSRPGTRGTGFSALTRALADLDGLLLFRSGGARLRLDGRGPGNRVATTSNSPKMHGFQLSVAARPMDSRW